MSNPASATHAENPAILDMAAIAEAKATMKDKFPKMIGYFLEDSVMYVTKVEEGFASGNAEAIVPPAHTLKSSARQMGAALLSSIAKDIELNAREIVKGNGSLSQIAPRIPELKAALAQTQEAYKSVG